ncbi:hypothetical protein VUR80DRAFT_511 [Thermomyces stellatus]
MRSCGSENTTCDLRVVKEGAMVVYDSVYIHRVELLRNPEATAGQMDMIGPRTDNVRHPSTRWLQYNPSTEDNPKLPQTKNTSPSRGFHRAGGCGPRAPDMPGGLGFRESKPADEVYLGLNRAFGCAPYPGLVACPHRGYIALPLGPERRTHEDAFLGKKDRETRSAGIAQRLSEGLGNHSG